VHRLAVVVGILRDSPREVETFECQFDGEKAAAVELALEGLYLARRISKDPDDDGQTVYS
ncbi:MAG: hypothetical protein EOP29_28495, partial [Rhodococcus sp. (in: high G+C Gram-positive bacteria)]